ncbi:ATP-binding protein (plasmid) [Rhodococcus aetherivorans]|uniref:sensor histidine kinase n=1 Tax=Rhodococcus aetherivorans TaxID=191292 RepID=UPI0016165982|nr:ATP-binding protein [Rhodococcus aetherivorans]
MRAFARFIGAGYLFYLLLLLPNIVSFAGYLWAWWTPVAVATVFGSGLWLGAAGIRGDSRLIRTVAAIAATAYLGAALTWPLAWVGQPSPDRAGFWLVLFPGLAALAAAVAWPAGLAVGYLLVATVAVQVFNQSAHTDQVNGPLLPDVLFAVVFSLLFVAAAVMALRTGRILDDTRAASHEAAAHAARATARAVERKRFAALIHDHVMATLLSAARLGTDPSVSRQAKHAIVRLDELRHPAPDVDFDAGSTVTHLRTSATASAPTVVVCADLDPAAIPVSLPAEAVRTIGAAVSEAVRNSMLHAGEKADRSVTVRIRPGQLEVEVLDNGRGFDVCAVSPHRLGVAVSIVGRLRQLPGGDAVVESQPGRGTRVLLSWRANA